MTIQLPESLTYGKVVGRFLRAVGDTSADVDNIPDGVAATGSVTFTPALVVSKEPSNDPQTAVIRDQIPAVLDSQGYLTDPAGNRGIWLVAGVYKVAYNISGVTIPGHNIEVLASHTELAPLRLIANMTSSGAVLTVSQYSELSGRIDTLNTVSVDIDGTPIVGTDRLVTEPSLQDPSSPAGSYLNSTFALQREYDARMYGASPSASWTVNRDAFQAANDAASAAGGGRVTCGPGNYTVKGIIQDSRVEFYLPGVTLSSPDGAAPDIIRARERDTTGTLTGTTLTVTDATGFEVGAIVSVRAAAGVHTTQATTLTGAVDGSQTTGIILTDKTAYPSTGWMVSGSEVIAYTGITVGRELTGVTRGAYGTTAAAHGAGDSIGMAARLLAEVTAVVGTTITIDTTATVNVTGAPVKVGAVQTKVTGARFAGNRVNGGSVTENYPIRWDQVRWGRVSDVRVDNAEGALMLRRTRDCTVDRFTANDCGAPEASKGSSVWLFQSCRRNKLTHLTITGDTWVSVYMDDRTTTADEYDGPNVDNVVDGFTIKVKQYTYNPALVVAGSSRNRFTNGSIRGAYTGISLTTDQAHLPGGAQPACKGNEFASIAFSGVGTPWILNAGGNVLHDCTFDGILSLPSNSGGSLVYAVPTVDGGQPTISVSFPDGTVSAPGITFASDPNSGFIRQAEDQISLVLGAAMPVRFFKTETRLGEGVHLAFGTTVGSRIGFTNTQKLAFWGSTPTVQPAAVADATDAASVITQLNALLARLRSIGLIAT